MYITREIIEWLKFNVISTGSNAKTCAGLAQLAMNANPLTLSKCVRDDSCSRLTCQTNGSLRSQLDTFVLTLAPCKTPPGVLFEFMKGGKSLVSQMITKPIQINGTVGSAMLEADVFVNTTGNDIGISVSIYACTDNWLHGVVSVMLDY